MSVSLTLNQGYDLPEPTEVFVLISVCFDPHVPDSNSSPSAEGHLHRSLSRVPLLSVDLIRWDITTDLL